MSNTYNDGYNTVPLHGSFINRYNYLANELKINNSKITSKKNEHQKTFLNQIDQLINWNPIKLALQKYFKNDEFYHENRSYNTLLLFKICLLQVWYRLNENEIEHQINDKMSFKLFCNLDTAKTTPNHKTLTKFHQNLKSLKLQNTLTKEINRQLENQKFIIKLGTIRDPYISLKPEYVK
ncbi:transposase [Tenacibaculum sp. C7A-26P2]|uniref:transposase n=1 Tax=Tenacibaculum sp. C7A-26P2 TaxID=3447504 RepID=UPI003F848DBD